MAGAWLGTWFYTWFCGQKVGRDQYGNRYFRARGGGRVHGESIRRERRWVIYPGEVEASRVPPDWHAWLHHTSDHTPPDGGWPKRPWQKEHEPNRTGTSQAYRPPGRAQAEGDGARGWGGYEPWTPCRPGPGSGPGRGRPE